MQHENSAATRTAFAGARDCRDAGIVGRVIAGLSVSHGTVGLGSAGRGAADFATRGNAVVGQSASDEIVQADPQVAIGFHVKTLPNKNITTIAGIPIKP